MRVTTADDKQITVCSRPFKEYRQLRNEILINLEELEKEGLVVLPEFPETFRRSSFGLALDEKQIVQRVRALDCWIRAIGRCYPVLSNRSQLFINHFLNLDCLVNNEKYEQVIHDQFKIGNVFREQEEEDSYAAPSVSPPSSGHSDDGKGKYGVVREAQDLPPEGKIAEGGEWTVIGGKKEESAAPKGCCIIS